LSHKLSFVRFYTANDLVTQLEEAQKENLLSKLMDKILSPDLLIIDELGFVPFSDNGSRLLFDIFSKRYEQGSILVTTNLDLPKWIQTFGSKELTKVLIDRYAHRCDIYVFEGESYRFLESKSEAASCLILTRPNSSWFYEMRNGGHFGIQSTAFFANLFKELIKVE